MTKITTSLRPVLGLALFALALGSVAAATSLPARAQNQHMDIIHHPNYDRGVFMPFVPGIKIKSGKILWLAGTTALPVYHDHPHKREQILQHMPNDLEAQTRSAMDGIKLTLDAAGAYKIEVDRLMRYSGWHLLGTARMGDDPKTSVLDRWNRTHDVPNLYVVDGSCFVTSSGVNPTSTIVSIALRAADHMIETRFEQQVPA